MNEKCLKDTYLIKDCILESDIYKNLNDLEEKINNDEEIMILAYKKDMLIVEYEDLLKFNDKNSLIALAKMKEIKEVVDQINNFELVQEYNKFFKEYKEIEDFINKEIFVGILND